MTHCVCGKELHTEQSLLMSVYSFREKGQISSQGGEILTATKVVGRYIKVTTVITLMVAESWTAVFVNASVCSLVSWEIRWCFRFKVSETSWAVLRILSIRNAVF